MSPQQSPDVVKFYLDALERPSKPLTAWELDFLASISEQFEQSSSLSSKQFSVLERLYTEKTS